MNNSAKIMTVGAGLVCLLLVVVVTAPAVAQSQDANTELVFNEQSSLWFEGSSTVHDWACREVKTSGTIHIPGLTAAEGINPAELVSIIEDTGAERPSAELEVPVKQMKCSKDGMNPKMYKALKAEKHPTITYRMETVSVKSVAPEKSTLKLKTQGVLTVAGTEDQIDMSVSVEQSSDTAIRVTGKKDLKMSQFDVERPTAMWGTIQAYDDVTVHFEMIAAVSQPESKE